MILTKKAVLLGWLCTSLQAASGQAALSNNAAADPTLSAKGATALTLSAIKNCTYKYEGHDGFIRLKNGRAAGKFPGSTIFGWSCQIEELALGDLDDDGNADGVMAIGYNGGGSGYFVNLVAMINKRGKAVQGDSYDLGDRVEIKNIKIDQGKVTVMFMDHAPNEGLASASVRKVICLRLNKKGKWQKC